VSEEAPPVLPPRKRLAIEQPLGSNSKRGGLLVYGALTAALVGVAVYMALAAGHPLASPYVAGPGIGALWFALRLFMIWGSNARG
jgi:hypothetical protein